MTRDLIYHNGVRGLLLIRTWSTVSGGRLNSETGFLSGRDKEVRDQFEPDQFRLHKELGNRIPTIFVSTTDYLLWALKTGVNRWLDKEQGVQLSFIFLPQTHLHLVKNAEDLAATSGLKEPHKYCREYVFKMEIERRLVIFSIPMDQLINENRLFTRIPSLNPDTWPNVQAAFSPNSVRKLPSTREIREEFISNLKAAYLSQNRDSECGKYMFDLTSLFGCYTAQDAILAEIVSWTKCYPAINMAVATAIKNNKHIWVEEKEIMRELALEAGMEEAWESQQLLDELRWEAGMEEAWEEIEEEVKLKGSEGTGIMGLEKQKALILVHDSDEGTELPVLLFGVAVEHMGHVRVTAHNYTGANLGAASLA